jgi:hypothetical protein
MSRSDEASRKAALQLYESASEVGRDRYDKDIAQAHWVQKQDVMLRWAYWGTATALGLAAVISSVILVTNGLPAGAIIAGLPGGLAGAGFAYGKAKEE